MADTEFTVKFTDKVGPAARAAARAVEKFGASLSRLKAGLPAVQSGFERNRGAMSDWRTQAVFAAKSAKRLKTAQRSAIAPTAQLSTSGIALGNVLAMIAQGALRAAMAVVRFGARAVVAFGKAVVGATMLAGKATLAFDLLTGGQGMGKAMLKDVVDFAVGLGAPVEETIQSFQRLLAMQFTPEAAKDVIRMASDLQAIGADAEKVSAIIRAMTQIKAKGRLQSEELLQLAEAGVSIKVIQQELAKATGKSVKEVQKLIQAGKITGEQGLEAIKQAVLAATKTKKLGDATARAGKLLGGMWAGLKSKAEAMLITFGMKIGPALSKAIIPILKDVTEWLDSPRAKEMFDSLVSGAKALAKWLGSVWDMAKKMASAFGAGYREGFEATSEFMKGVNEIEFDLSAEDMQLAVDGLVQLAKALGKLAGAAEAAGKAWKSLPDFGASGFGQGGSAPGLGGEARDPRTLFPLGDPTRFTADWLPDLDEQGKQAGTSLTTGLKSGIQSGKASVITAAVDVAKSAISAAKRALGIGSPSKVFAGIGKDVAIGMQRGITAGSQDVSMAAAKMIDPAKIGGGGGNTQHIQARANVPITIQAAEDPEATAAAVQRSLRASVVGLFEDAAIQVSVVGANG